MQLSLEFKRETQENILVPIDKLIAHPLNPRPFSDKYQERVFDEKVEELIELIKRDGFNEPLTCRELPSGEIQILSGHHRWVAADEVGLETLPCRLVEVDDKAAAMLLLELQGKEVGSWERARHAYECCAAYGEGGLLTVSEYAERAGKKHNSISEQIAAALLGEHDLAHGVPPKKQGSPLPASPCKQALQPDRGEPVTPASDHRRAPRPGAP
jgi:ParB/RepB/Spo0J family partition protein